MGEQILDFPKAVLYQASKSPGISFWTTLECRHMKKYDVIALDDVRHSISILGNL
jgi:hypothetical protein